MNKFATFLLFAQEVAEDPGKSYSISWGIVLACVVVGLLITLKPTKRGEVEAKPLIK